MKKKIVTILLCFMMILPCIACSNEKEDQKDYPLSQLESDTEIIYCGDTETLQKDIEIGNIPIEITDFSVRLLQTELQNAKENENRLLSPFSVLTAMSMLGNGAKGETKTQIEEVMGISIDNLNAFISRYMQELSKEKTRFHMANSIWLTEDNRFTVKESFLKTNKDYYDADIFQKPFNQTTVSEINQWIDENTEGLIKEVLDEIPKDAVMYVINALVFDAKWEEKYEEMDIKEGIFTTDDGEKQNVDMMYSSEIMYLEDENAIGFMKFYEDRDYAFVAILPNEAMSLSEYINTLSGENLYNLLLNVEEVTTHVWLPQFEVEYEAQLKDNLEQMGIMDVFDAKRADLSDLGTSTHGNLYVDRAIHKTFMEVSPVGTKAGAATIVEVRDECAILEPVEVKEVRLDRPFLYMIIDCKYNHPIFMGTVNEIEF